MLRSLNNPYWYQIIALIILAGYNILFSPMYLPQVLLSVAVAGFLDFIIKYKKEKIKGLPKSGIITGLLIGSILSGELYVFIAAPIIAIVLKNIIKWNGNIFNPAALGIIISILLFSAVDVWWSSSPAALVFVAGLFVAYKVRRWRASFSYMAIYFVLALLQAGGSFSSLYTAVISIPFFLGFLMLTDPATSPRTSKGQAYFGALAAVLSYAFLYAGVQAFILLALLVSNVAFSVKKNMQK